MTGLPASFALRTISFCAFVTCSIGISTPRSPRATMIPSAIERIESKFAIACVHSIFAMTSGGADVLPLSRMQSLMWSCTSLMSASLRTNDAAMNSASASTPMRTASRSDSVRHGRSISPSGMLTFFFDLSRPGFCTRAVTSPFSTLTDSTVSAITPSSRSTTEPGCTADESLA
eukprot:Amastigsp_a509033_21.p4 type:complete len:174 gc:universal Amastigsp_a509033_21:735-1256(+)